MHIRNLLLTCDQNDREVYYCTKPCLTIEVLSEITERIDRREKCFDYQTIPSLREYLLVAQNRRELQIHRRSRGWVSEVIIEEPIRLDCLDCTIGVDVIDEDVLPKDTPMRLR